MNPRRSLLGHPVSPRHTNRASIPSSGTCTGVQLRELRHRKAQAVPSQAMRPITVGFVHLQGPAKASLYLPMPSKWGVA